MTEIKGPYFALQFPNMTLPVMVWFILTHADPVDKVKTRFNIM